MAMVHNAIPRQQEAKSELEKREVTGQMQTASR